MSPTLGYAVRMKTRFAALLGCFFVAGCGGPAVESISPPATPIDKDHAVVVVQKPINVQHGTFVENQNAHSSRGLTEWFFHCYPEFLYNLSTRLSNHNIEATIKITKVTLTISCPVTIRIGADPDKKTFEHENGHLQIVKQIYATADDVAKEACQPIIGKQFIAEGVDVHEATANAIDQAARELCKNYTDRTVVLANELSKNYDEISQHGYSKIDVPRAIELSEQKYKHTHEQQNTHH
ncbi:hypothetical protein BH10CYA1_BH10CYA1_52080 [soil metagenome]